tara:strand:- start:5003 stop:5245 length:243 start_codon:yes stop_codon:yes gene_type:complete
LTNQEKLVQSFVESLGIKPEQVVDDLKYQSIEEWDSVGHMALVAELEANFDIMLDTDDIIDMSSVAIAKTILQKYEVSFA